MATSAILEKARSWAGKAKDWATPVAVIFAALTYCGNVCIECNRWHAHLSVKLTVSANIYLAQLTPTGSKPPEHPSTETLNLMVRNQSFRPAAIIDVTLFDANGSVMQVPDSTCEAGMMPLTVKPWQIVPCRIVMSLGEYNRLVRVIVKDGEDHVVTLRVHEKEAPKWSEFPR